MKYTEEELLLYFWEQMEEYWFEFYDYQEDVEKLIKELIKKSRE